MNDYESSVRDRILRRTARSLREFGYPNAKPDQIVGDRVYREFLKRDLRDAMNEDLNPTLLGVLKRLLEECESAAPA